MEPKWLIWAREIQSIARAGLTYSKDKYDLDRFNQLEKLAAEIISEYTQIGVRKVEELLAQETGYLTPKVDVRGAIIKDNRILLVKESQDGLWSMPGGWADVNLSISENIIKEAKEEAGVSIIPKKIIAILDRNRYNKPISMQSIYTIFVLCEFVNGKFERNIETEESRFFEQNHLPDLSITRSTKEQVEMCFKAHLNCHFETLFD